jgi:hypothetical protein
MIPSKRIAGQWLLALSLALSGGCAGYRLGPTNGTPAGQRSVQVAYFQNLTPQPRVSEAIDASLRRSLQQDGTYRLATSGTGDIVVSGKVVRYERPALSFQSSDTRTLQDYRLRVVAQVIATDRVTGKVLFDREVVGSTVVRAGDDQSGVERQALPLAADDLARRTTGLLVDGEW